MHTTHFTSWIGSGIFALCGLSAVALAADVPAYKVDSTFSTAPLATTPVCIAATPQDQIVVLLANGSVMTYDVSGKTVSEFACKLSPSPSTMTLANGKIYLLSTQLKTEEMEFQGKKVKRQVASGASCAVFTPTGTKESEFALPEVMSTRDAHFIDDELAVGDYQKSQIVFYKINNDKATVAKKVEGQFRLCCGIFDFCPTVKGDSMFVANLGAFKVQTYSNHRKRSEFGARGEKLEEFHGCCNPVNVAALGSDFIVTVEKAPTRVKICDLKGKDAKIIDGLGELVNGCSTIPVVVDSKGAIYLASATKNCIVKCVTDAPPKGLPAATTSTVAPSQPKHNELSEVRKWQDAQSGKEVTGKLIAFDGAERSVVRDGKVRLLVGDKTFELPLARLAQADQDFVATLRGQLTAKNAQ